MLALFATSYGIGAALAVLLQARQMLERGRSCEVSVLFLAIYAFGYAVWFAYGVDLGSAPLVLVNGVGFACAACTLIVALALRGSLSRPSTWSACRVVVS